MWPRRLTAAFSRLAMARGLNRLKDSIRSRRAFVIGNGPSLTFDDLGAVERQVSFASNMVYRSFSKTAWRPTYYVVGDAQVAKNYGPEIFSRTEATLLVADFIKDFFPRSPRVVCFPKEHENFSDREPLFSSDPTQIVYGGYTVTFLMIQLAWWLGARELYVLGVDCKWNVTDYVSIKRLNALYELAEVQRSTSYFISDYFRPGERCIAPTKVREQVLSLTSARKFIEANGGKIFNVSQNSPLDVFPRKPISSVV